jgi:hypothetical protein
MSHSFAVRIGLSRCISGEGEEINSVNVCTLETILFHVFHRSDFSIRICNINTAMRRKPYFKGALLGSNSVHGTSYLSKGSHTSKHQVNAFTRITFPAVLRRPFTVNSDTASYAENCTLMFIIPPTIYSLAVIVTLHNYERCWFSVPVGWWGMLSREDHMGGRRFRTLPRPFCGAHTSTVFH